MFTEPLSKNVVRMPLLPLVEAFDARYGYGPLYSLAPSVYYNFRKCINGVQTVGSWSSLHVTDRPLPPAALASTLLGPSSDDDSISYEGCSVGGHRTTSMIMGCTLYRGPCMETWFQRGMCATIRLICAFGSRSPTLDLVSNDQLGRLAPRSSPSGFSSIAWRDL